jgi:hypothetical protein
VISETALHLQECAWEHWPFFKTFKINNMKRLIWFGTGRPKDMTKPEYHNLVNELAKVIGGEVVAFTKSTPEKEATFMIIGD